MKSYKEYILESILDDEEDILDRADEIGLEALMVQRLNGFDHDFIYNERPSDFVKSVEINGNKLTAYMDTGYRRCGFQLYDIDLRYETILELIDEGYDITLKAATQSYSYGAVQCNSLAYYVRTWDEAMHRMFKLISNPKFHMVDKSEIKPSNMIIMIDDPMHTKVMDFTGLPKVFKIIYDIGAREVLGYTVKGAHAEQLHILGLPQRHDEITLIGCRADKLYIDSRNRANEITFQGIVDFNQSTFEEVYLDENNLYLFPYMIACIIPEFDHFHTKLEDSLRGVFQSKKRRATDIETMEMMNKYFEDHPELINKFNKISRKFTIRTEGHTWELITKKTLLSRKTILQWKKTH